MGKILALVDFGDKSVGVQQITTHFCSVYNACREYSNARNGWLHLDDKNAVNLAEVTILAFYEIEE